jgi:nucleoside-diphosphate-sugar epimerase
MNLFLTGASGFVGRAILHAAQMRGLSVLPVFRSVDSARRAGVLETSAVVEGGLTEDADWRSALSGQHVVIHSAARVHVMNDNSVDPLAEFRKVNVNGTLNLARQAATAGVRRFVFISSIKVNGEGTGSGRPYTADDAPAPVDPYGISKHEAEVGLRALAEKTGLEVVIIRPVLVYGPGVKANFASMVRWVGWGVPLPLGLAVDNRRSLVALDNLVDLVLCCVDHPAAVNQTFLASDGEDLSTADLLRGIARAQGRTSRLLDVPVWLLLAVARLLGKGAVAQRLLGSLQVDSNKTRELLGWTPPVSVCEGLRRAVKH